MQVSDAIIRETGQFPALSFVSPDGKSVFCVYELVATKSCDVRAELFDITNCKLKSVAQYHGDMTFVSVDGGAASPDFTRFSVVEDNQQEGEDGAFKVTVLKYKCGRFLIVNELVVAAYVSGYTPLGGTFTANGKHIVVSAVTRNTRPTQTSTLWLLDAKTLCVADSLVKARIFTVPASAFELDCKQYFAISTSGGVLNFDNLPKYWQPKHKVCIFSVKCGCLKLESSDELPQGALSVSAFTRCDRVKITVGTYTALPECKPTIPVKNCTNLAAECTDGKELRIYNFDGCELKKRVAENTNAPVEAIFLADHQTVRSIVAINTGSYSEFAPSFFTIEREGCDQTFPCNNFASFSSDECNSVFVLSTASDPAGRNNNVVLFTVN